MTVSCLDIRPFDRNSVAVLGQLKQCQHKVLREIATRYKQMFGPVARWKEEDFAEAGIVLGMPQRRMKLN